MPPIADNGRTKAAKNPALEDLVGYPENDDTFVLAIMTVVAELKQASGMTFVTISAAPVLKAAAGGKVTFSGESAAYLSYESANEGMDIKLTATNATFEYFSGISWKTIKATKSVTIKMLPLPLFA